MMNSKFFLFSKRFLLLLIVIQGSSAAKCQTCHQTMSDRTVTNEQLDKDFENNEVFPWVEDSQNGVQWKIENKSSPWEMKNIAPQPLSGGNYLRVHRGISFSSFGVAVLRSPTFTLLPGQIDFSFSFWIRSKWSQFTNLELYMAKDGNERLLITLHNYSNINNRIWQSLSVPLNDALPSNISLVFYAYCGTETEDAVAIDNLRFLSKELTTLSPSTTVSTTITQSTTTSRSTTPYTTSTESPTTKRPTTQPAITTPSITELTTTHQPLTDAPITEPPTTELPATEPPTTEPPTTEPPTTEPPTTKPPITTPSITELTTTHQPLTDAPTEPPTTELPATEPLTTESPATEPPTTKPSNNPTNYGSWTEPPTEPPIEPTTASVPCTCPTPDPCYLPVSPYTCVPQYYMCYNGSLLLQECQNPDVFDPSFSSCIHPIFASCKIQYFRNPAKSVSRDQRRKWSLKKDNFFPDTENAVNFSRCVT